MKHRKPTMAGKGPGANEEGRVRGAGAGETKKNLPH